MTAPIPIEKGKPRRNVAAVQLVPDRPSGEVAAATEILCLQWDAPIPFDDAGTLPEFPVGVLPAALREWVIAEAEATQTPPALAGLLALSVVSAIVARHLEAEGRPGWREPLCLFVLVALLSGERKSAVYRDATAPIRSWEAARAKDADPKIHAALTQKAIKEKVHKAAVEKAAKSRAP